MIISDVVKSVIRRVLDMRNGRDDTFVFLAQVWSLSHVTRE